MLARLYRQPKTIAGKANLLGSYEVFYGDYRNLFTADKEISKVTAADVQAVAKQYFTLRTKPWPRWFPKNRRCR